MKKITSLLIVIIICCFALVGCGLQNMGAIISDKLFHIEGTTLTSAETTDGNAVYITHGENFNQDDIDFVAMLHGQIRYGYRFSGIYPAPNYTCHMILSAGQRGEPVFLAHCENPYVIVGYLKSLSLPNVDELLGYEYYFDVTKYIWYKFYDLDQISEKIEGMQRSEEKYILYDCIIEKDIVNGTEYNRQLKAYVKYREWITPTMLLYFEPACMEEYLGDDYMEYPQYGGGTLEIYTDENGVDYVYFPYEVVYQDGSKFDIGKLLFYEHYSDLSPYFEYFGEEINERGELYKYAGIRLDIIIEYLH